MLGVDIIAGYFVVGIVWGATNAFMEIGAQDDEKAKAAAEKDGQNELKEGVKMFTKLAFLVPFLINQTASILNNFLVAKSDLSLAVPIVNCITFIMTFITARLIKKYQARQQGKAGPSLLDSKFFLGSLLIMAGLYFCINKD